MNIMKKINGPINVVRMEGIIDNTKKVIYLFMDQHQAYQYQSDCNDPDNSINIAEYFKENFTELKNTNKTYDFFLEFDPELLSHESDELFFVSDPEIIYIETVWKFFMKIFGLNHQIIKYRHYLIMLGYIFLI